MTNLQLRDLVKRALWAGLWSFLSSFIALAPGILAAPNLTEARALTVGAFAASVGAALSAVKSFILTYRK